MTKFMRVFKKCVKDSRLKFNAVKVEKVEFLVRRKLLPSSMGK